MKESFQLGKLFGIPVKIHWSFALLLIYVIGSSIYAGGGVESTVFGVIFTFGIFFCVVAHEYGHALTARKYGIETMDIILSPIGGVARLKSIPEKPIQEFWVTVMGPVVNLVIILLCAGAFLIFFTGDGFDISNIKSVFVGIWDGFLQIAGGVPEESGSGDTYSIKEYVSSFLILLAIVNLLMFVFNLIPAFPMDGGRIFRSLLAMVMPRVKATRIASYTGQVIGIGFIAAVAAHHLVPGVTIVLADNIFLAFIGFFVFRSAKNELAFTEEKAKVDSITLSQIGEEMGELSIDTDLRTAKIIVEDTDKSSYLINNAEGQPVGVLSKFDVLLNARERDMELKDLIRDDQVLQELEETESVESVFKQVITTENVVFYLFRQAEQRWYNITKDSMSNFIRNNYSSTS